MRNQALDPSLVLVALLGFGCSPNDPGQAFTPGDTGANEGGAINAGGNAVSSGDEDSSPSSRGGTTGRNDSSRGGTQNLESNASKGGSSADVDDSSAQGGTGTSSSAGGSSIKGSATGGKAQGGAAATSSRAVGGNSGKASTTGGKAQGGATTATSGESATGGAAVGTTGTHGGSCSRAIGACTSPAVSITEVNVGTAVTGYGQEGDTDPFPMAIAAMPSGGSRLAWLGTDKKIYVAELDCDDKLVGSPFSFPAVDLQDIIADDSGGVVLLTRDATNGGTDNCGTGKLCGGTSSPCRTMWMVRFDNSGAVVWETQVTNLSSSLAGYQNGARFIWWYQHHGRLAFDGSNYAAFFGVAITVNNGSCVDIHEGDRMQVVGPTGTLLTGHNSFEVGMSHAWTSRIVWDARASKFAMADATDNNCRIAIPGAATTIASGTCDGTLFNGDLVLSTTSGYWDAWSQGGSIRLEHFTTGKSDKTVTAGKAAHPHLVSYGARNMLLAWSSGSGMAAQVRDAGAAADTVGSEFTIVVNDHDYGAFKAYSDGSVAYAASGSNNKSIKIARVLPCE